MKWPATASVAIQIKSKHHKKQMLRIEICNLNPFLNLGHVPFDITTFTGPRRHSLVTNGPLPRHIGILTGISAKTTASGLRVEAANPNVMGPVVFGVSRSYVIVNTWVYSINASATPGQATHAFAERRINNVWQLVLMPVLGAAAGAEIFVYYRF